MSESKIKMELVETNVYTRWPCTVCGGTTEKVSILCEGHNPDSDNKANSMTGWMREAVVKEKVGNTRVCERCLEAGNIDERLREHADYLEDEAKRLRGLVGRLQVPTYAEWQAAYDAHELRWVQENTGFKTVAEYEAHLTKTNEVYAAQHRAFGITEPF